MAALLKLTPERTVAEQYRRIRKLWYEYYQNVNVNVNVKPIANEKRRDEENERTRNGERKPRRGEAAAILKLTITQNTHETQK